MANKYMLDSSAWIEYFLGSESGARIKDIVEGDTTVTSILSIAEISDKFSREKERFAKFLAFIKNVSSVVNITILSCSESGRLKAERRKIKKKFSLADAIIYLSAKENSCTLVTLDYDFDNMENVKVIE